MDSEFPAEQALGRGACLVCLRKSQLDGGVRSGRWREKAEAVGWVLQRLRDLGKSFGKIHSLCSCWYASVKFTFLREGAQLAEPSPTGFLKSSLFSFSQGLEWGSGWSGSEGHPLRGNFE